MLRLFVGIATLRALNVGELRPEMQEEPLGGRLRILSIENETETDRKSSSRHAFIIPSSIRW